MRKFGAAARMLVATGLVLGVSGCGAPEDTYRDFMDLQAAALSSGMPCAQPAMETREGGAAYAACSDGIQLVLRPGETVEEIWDRQRDNTVLALGPLDEQTILENEDDRSLLLIGHGFSARGNVDSRSQFEALAKRGGTLKTMSLRLYLESDTPWSKVKSAD